MFKEDLYNSAQAAEEAKPFASSALHSYRFSRGRLAIQARSQQTSQPQRHRPCVLAERKLPSQEERGSKVERFGWVQWETNEKEEEGRKRRTSVGKLETAWKRDGIREEIPDRDSVTESLRMYLFDLSFRRGSMLRFYSLSI
jgi:hypothetical protein